MNGIKSVHRCFTSDKWHIRLSKLLTNRLVFWTTIITVYIIPLQTLGSPHLKTVSTKEVTLHIVSPISVFQFLSCSLPNPFYLSCWSSKHSILKCWVTYSKDWPAKKVTIYFPIFYLVKSSENILFFYLHFTWLCG